MKTAHFVRSMHEWKSHAALYRLSEPLRDGEYLVPEGTEREYEYVVVSAVVVPFTGDETYIFGADQYGNVERMSELPGSGRGHLSHARALSDAGGYVIVGR